MLKVIEEETTVPVRHSQLSDNHKQMINRSQLLHSDQPQICKDTEVAASLVHLLLALTAWKVCSDVILTTIQLFSDSHLVLAEELLDFRGMSIYLYFLHLEELLRCVTSL